MNLLLRIDNLLCLQVGWPVSNYQWYCLQGGLRILTLEYVFIYNHTYPTFHV